MFPFSRSPSWLARPCASWRLSVSAKVRCRLGVMVGNLFRCPVTSFIPGHSFAPATRFICGLEIRSTSMIYFGPGLVSLLVQRKVAELSTVSSIPPVFLLAAKALELPPFRGQIEPLSCSTVTMAESFIILVMATNYERNTAFFKDKAVFRLILR